MNSFTTKKMLTLVVICLLVANVVTLGLFLFNRGDKKARPNGKASDFLITTLRFSVKQKADYLKLVEAHQQAIRPVREELKTAKETLFDLLQQPNPSENDKIQAAKSASSLTEKLDLITFNHFLDVRKLCDPAQQQKFDSVIKQVLRMIAEPHQGGPRPPHRPMDGRPGEDMPPPPGPDGMPPPPPHE